MDIVELLQLTIHLESAAIAPKTSRSIETMRLAKDEIERLRAAMLFASNDLAISAQKTVSKIDAASH